MGNCFSDAQPRIAERPKVSSSVVVAGEGRTHVIKIDGYSRTTQQLETGMSATSIPFMVGNHYWVVEYYPNGNYAPGHISVYLALDTADAKDVKAKFTFSVLDKGGEPVHIKTSTIEYTFPRKGSYWGFNEFMKHEDLQGSVHLNDDSLRIRCDVTVVKKIHRKETKGNRFVVVPPTDLHRHLGDLLKTMDGADVTFQVGGETFLAHRSVLAARSSVFRAELLGAMKEKSDSPIVIDDMESDVFKSLLQFIYTDSLPVLQAAMTSHLLVAADRFAIERLKLICENKLCNQVDSNMVATSLALAEQHSCHGLKEACFEFLASPTNLKAMIASDGYEHLKSSCPHVLRELIARLLPIELIAAKDIIMTI